MARNPARGASSAPDRSRSVRALDRIAGCQPAHYSHKRQRHIVDHRRPPTADALPTRLRTDVEHEASPVPPIFRATRLWRLGAQHVAATACKDADRHRKTKTKAAAQQRNAMSRCQGEAPVCNPLSSNRKANLRNRSRNPMRVMRPHLIWRHVASEPRAQLLWPRLPRNR
jgi:hypothetical protein